jgi:hypothetical protein
MTKPNNRVGHHRSYAQINPFPFKFYGQKNEKEMLVALPAIAINLCYCPLHLRWAQLIKQQMIWSVGGGPRQLLGRTSTAVEAHVEEEWARGVDLDGGRTYTQPTGQARPEPGRARAFEGVVRHGTE